jgi:hypothetical protein
MGKEGGTLFTSYNYLLGLLKTLYFSIFLTILYDPSFRFEVGSVDL